MKKLLDWIKENPVSAGSAVVAFVCMLVVVYFIVIAAGSLTSRIAEENERPAQQLRTLSGQTVSVPDPDPNSPPREFGPMVLNDGTIERVRSIFERIRDQQAFIKGETEARNSAAHEPHLFMTLDETQKVRATQDYVDSFRVMFDSDEFDENRQLRLAMPIFRAGPPPTVEQIQNLQAQTVADYVESMGAESANALTKKQAEDLYRIQQVTLLRQLSGRARSLDLYADLPIDDEDAEEAGSAPTPFGGRGGFGGGPSSFELPGAGFGAAGPGFGRTGAAATNAQAYGPFLISAWAYAEIPPSLEQLWDGQVQVWIVRDIMNTIATTNRVGEMVTVVNAAGETEQIPENVMTAPVKQLFNVDILPGYVGLHTYGAVAGPLRTDTAMHPAAETSNITSPDGEEFAGGGEFGPGPGFGRPGAAGTGVGTDQSAYQDPAVKTLPEPREKLEGNFFFGPTGRRSNGIYDVRHARVRMHIEWDKLPLFFENLRQTNFMTVLDMTVSDVDEYAMLQAGYVYGEGDVVEITFTIETLWFRTWTTQYMPASVKKKLAVREVADQIRE